MILNDIIASIRSASVIIADITPDNPNVFYEVGYAHALAKPTILLCEKGIRNKLPFDVSGFRTIFYDNTIGGKRQIEDKLRSHLQSIDYSIQIWRTYIWPEMVCIDRTGHSEQFAMSDFLHLFEKCPWQNAQEIKIFCQSEQELLLTLRDRKNFVL